LTLLDLKLPKRGGLDVLKAIRENERTRLYTVVVLTSSVEEEDLVSAYGLGANSYIRKPVDFNKFVVVMQQVGMYWLLINEPAPRS
jgi:two-component system response regulator